MPDKLGPWEFWNQVLGKPRLVLAPMVDASELAWRLLSKRYGAQLVYTPMFHALNFTKDPRYRLDHLQTCKEDHPLIVQFAANDPETFVQAGKLAEPHCVAIDLNLGCPQSIAKRGRYGSFLQDEWDLIESIVKKGVAELSVPVTCKIRVFPDVDKTIAYAKMIEAAGCYALTVHGRTRDQKGPQTGLADWEQIRAVKNAVKIPVIANGNIQFLSDAERCLAETGVDAVMTAEGNLTNPAIFHGIQPHVWEIADEYLEIVEKYPCNLSYVRGHLFKLFNHCLIMPECTDIRQVLAKANDLSEMKQASTLLRAHFNKFADGSEAWEIEESTSTLKHPPWLCQPYVRPPASSQKRNGPSLEENKAVAESSTAEKEIRKRLEPDGSLDDEVEPTLSKKRAKKLLRNPYKTFGRNKREVDPCAGCPNPVAGKCAHHLCKTCCRTRCYVDDLDCPGHNIMIKSNRERRKDLATKNLTDETSHLHVTQL